MHKDERFDRLLERASPARAGTRPPGACLEPDTLAAWADGSLTGETLAAVERHTADCDRCLAMAAALARTTPPPSSPAPSWFAVRWLVPLATAAVALTAWVLVQQPGADLADRQAAPAAVDAVKPDDPSRQAERDEVAEPGTRAQREDSARPPLEKKQESAASAPAVAQDTGAARAKARSERRDERPVSPPAETAPVAPPAIPQAKPPDEVARFSARAIMAPLTIASPDPDVKWRIVANGVERTTDGGRTWRLQPTETTAELLAGASPSPTICWLVGRRGIVLLTTDGESWRGVPVPDATVDLVGVTAQDGLSASVRAADGRTYRTVDSGRTWVLQESPALPF